MGQKVGGELARQAAIKACGGWEYIKSTSDISFNSLDNMAVYIYAKYSNYAHYSEALKATMGHISRPDGTILSSYTPRAVKTSRRRGKITEPGSAK